jgi:methyl-accepting chemotaxis protein
MQDSHMSEQNPLQQRLTFMDFDAAARSRLKALKPLIEKAIGPALAIFFDKVRQTPETLKFFEDDKSMVDAKRRQEQHWAIISAAEYGEDYVRAVRGIGQTHARLGLEPRWYIGGYALVTEKLVHAVIEERWPSRLMRSRAEAAKVAGALSALIKAVMLDMDYVISIYLETLADQHRRAEDARAATAKATTDAVKVIATALGNLAKGDLVSRIDAGLASSFDGVKRDFNAAIDKLHETMAAVDTASQAIKTGAGEMAQAADDLSHRIEQQAASLEQSAAALAQLTTSVKQTAEAAVDVSRGVGAAKQDAQQSETVVQQAIGAMSEIEASSQKISNIIGVIDEIAFQTNLLALNAGVEAARAGEAGRGFAVVAQEVRALAQRSAEAAKEIKSLIVTSSEKVNAGVELVGATGQSLHRIIERVMDIDRRVTTITAMAKEQADGLGGVNDAIRQMDRLTQQNAGMVEQATAATRGFEGETDELIRLVKRFEIANDTSGSGRQGQSLSIRRARLAAFANS